MKIKIKDIFIKEEGITLIEIVVSISILTVVILPFINMLINLIKIEDDLAWKQQATFYLQRKIEEIKLMDQKEVDNLQKENEIIIKDKEIIQNIEFRDINEEMQEVKIILKSKKSEFEKIILSTGIGISE